LNAAALAVASEILLLLKHGYPAGAEARWRTLHEYCVTARLLSKRGQTLSRRYLDSRFPELQARLKDGSLMSSQARRSATGKALAAEIEARAADALHRHGSELARQYGWAYPVVKKRRITFRDLEAAAGAARRRPAYRASSHRVHASRTGSLSTLLVSGAGRLFVGRHFDGFATPGIRTVWSVDEVVGLVLREARRITSRPDVNAWNECVAQVALIADHEFRRAGVRRALETGDLDAAEGLTRDAAATLIFMTRDSAMGSSRVPAE
jgi:hypothetical protein